MTRSRDPRGPLPSPRWSSSFGRGCPRGLKVSLQKEMSANSSIRIRRCGGDSFQPARGMDPQGSELGQGRVQTRENAFSLTFSVGIRRAFVQAARLCQGIERVQQDLVEFRRRRHALVKTGLGSSVLGTIPGCCLYVQCHNRVQVKVQFLAFNLGQPIVITTGVLTLCVVTREYLLSGTRHLTMIKTNGSAKSTAKEKT